MKKIITIATIFICLVSSYLIVYSYGTMSHGNNFPDNCTTIKIKDNPTVYNNPADFIYAIEKVAENSSLEVYRTSYDVNDDQRTATTKIYTNAKVGGQLSNLVKLKSGTFINSGVENSKFISSLETSNFDQIGLINNFQTENPIEIYSLYSSVELPLGAQYDINTQDNLKVQNFKNGLASMGIECSVLDGYYIKKNSNTNMLLFISNIILFFSFYILLIITFTYYLSSRYKEFGIKRMNGISYKDIINKHIILDMSKTFVIAQIINFIVTVSYLSIYNKFALFLPFIAYWLTLQIGIFLFSVLIYYLISQIIRKIKLTLIIKNSNPYKTVNVINGISKVILASITIITLILSTQSVLSLKGQTNNMSKWGNIKQYVYFDWQPTMPPINNIESKKSEIEDEKNLYGFFKEINNKGGILFQPNDYYTDPELNMEYKSKLSDYDYLKANFANNNYLKMNPIFDSDGNKVILNDEDEKVVTILAPEKYKSNKEDILYKYKVQINRDYNSYIRLQNNYKKKSGITDTKEMLNEENIPVRIIFIKDNQKYFTLNTDYCAENNNMIKDPMTVVINNSTVYIDYLESYITQKQLLAKVEDIDHPKESLDEIINSKNMDYNVLRVNSLYKNVEQTIIDLRNQIIIQFTIIAICISILFIIILATVINNIETFKIINAIKRLHGYSMVSRYKYLFINTISTWVIIFSILSILDIALKRGIFKDIEINQIGFWCLIFLLVDIIISFLIIKSKELKKIKEVLKGD